MTKPNDVTAESIKIAIDKAVDECGIAIETALNTVEGGTTRWLMAARIVNRLWAIVYKPALQISLRTMGGTYDEESEAKAAGDV